MQSTAFKHTIGKKNLFPRPISLVRKTTEAKQLQFTSIQINTCDPIKNTFFCYPIAFAVISRSKPTPSQLTFTSFKPEP